MLKSLKKSFLNHCMTGPQELQVLVLVFCAPNNMFAYTFAHLTFCVPQVVACGCMDANVQLLQR